MDSGLRAVVRSGGFRVHGLRVVVRTKGSELLRDRGVGQDLKGQVSGTA